MATKRSTTENGKVPCFMDDDVEAAALVVPEELKDGPLTDEPSSVSSGPMQSRLTSEAITTLNSRPSCSQASTAVKFPFVAHLLSGKPRGWRRSGAFADH